MKPHDPARSARIADALVARLVAQGVGPSDPARASAILGQALDPLMRPVSLLAQIVPPDGVARESEVEISVALSPEQTRDMAAFYDARAAAGDPIPGPRPGPLNQPVHDMSDEDIAIATFLDLAQALDALERGDG